MKSVKNFLKCKNRFKRERERERENKVLREREENRKLSQFSHLCRLSTKTFLLPFSPWLA
jgi:hypothetical protein